MKKKRLIIIITTITAIFCLISISEVAYGAVSSIAELNVKGNEVGRVVAGSKATLILTVIADMSLALPGEEIKAARVTMPAGFSARAEDLISVILTVKTDEELPDVRTTVVGEQITFVLPRLITRTSTLTITFGVTAPPVETPEAQFVVSLINVTDEILIRSVNPGNADPDPKRRNDKLKLTVVPAVPPPVPQNLKVSPDPQGENDLIITWDMSSDPDVAGYFLYRDGERINIEGVETTIFRDVNVKPGRHAYVIEAYKTAIVKSPKSSETSATATADTKAPLPVQVEIEVKSTPDGFQISWKASESQDVIRYIIFVGASEKDLRQKGEVPVEKLDYIDSDPPSRGIFMYAVVAEDEAGNRSALSPKSFTQKKRAPVPVGPNPFTPRSSDPNFNRVKFDSKKLFPPETEGEFRVKIFSINGTLVWESAPELGKREIAWDGKDKNGRLVESGVYVYQAEMGDQVVAGTVVVAK
jgi:hypothetical protein